MNRRIGMAALAAGAMLMIATLAGCGPGVEKLRAQLDPVVLKITERAAAAAVLTGGQPAATIARTTELLTDLAGLGADLKSLYVEGEKQQALVAAGQAYLSATQRFITSQQEFARALTRLEAARGKVRESLEAKVRTSKFSMDFWKETHDRLVVDLDKVRKENEAARARLAAATTSLQQGADAAGALLGREKLISPATLDAHRKALDAVPLAKGA
jgi:hypothetical protein